MASPAACQFRTSSIWAKPECRAGDEAIRGSPSTCTGGSVSRVVAPNGFGGPRLRALFPICVRAGPRAADRPGALPRQPTPASSARSAKNTARFTVCCTDATAPARSPILYPAAALSGASLNFQICQVRRFQLQDGANSSERSPVPLISHQIFSPGRKVFNLVASALDPLSLSIQPLHSRCKIYRIRDLPNDERGRKRIAPDFERIRRSHAFRHPPPLLRSCRPVVRAV